MELFVLFKRNHSSVVTAVNVTELIMPIRDTVYRTTSFDDFFLVMPSYAAHHPSPHLCCPSAEEVLFIQFTGPEKQRCSKEVIRVNK